MNWITNLLRSRRMKDDVSDEIESHLAERAAELIDAGVNRDEAFNRARREFGNPTLIAERGRDVWAWTWLEHFWQDLRYSFRTLRRAPAFTTVALLSLALGIGGNTAVFSLLDAVMLKNLPVPHPEELRILSWAREGEVPMDNHSGYTTVHPRTGQHVSGSFSYPAYIAFRDHTPEFTGLVAYAGIQFTVSARSVTDYSSGEMVSGNYFPVLGARTLIGRPIAPSDDDPSQPLVAVITYRYWSRRFQQDPAVLGSQILINQQPATVIGVMPAGFQGLSAGDERDLFIPIGHVDVAQLPFWSRAVPDSWWVQVYGRLRPGASETAVAASLTATLGRAIEDYAPGVKPAGKPPVLLAPGARGVGLGRTRLTTAFYILGGTVCLVLLIACMNLANLLLARAAARQREVGIRLSIGATRGRLIRQLFTESILLSVLGGLAGLLISGPLTKFILDHQQTMDAQAFDVRIDLRTLAFTFAVSLFAGLIFGLVPAWRLTRSGVIKPGSTTVTHSRGRLRFHWVLISTQVAFSLILLVTAGLFTRTLTGLAHTDLGFETRNLLTFRTDGSRSGYKDLVLARVYDRLRQRIAGIPGVESVVLSSQGLINNSEMDGPVYFPSRPNLSPSPTTLFLNCSDLFLTAMRIPVIRGRDLLPSDGPDAPNVAVINEAFRKKYFPGEDPIGQIFYRQTPPLPSDAKPIQIVGVARDAHYYSVREVPSPTIYIHYLQRNRGIRGMSFAVRSPLPPSSLAAAVRRAAAEVDAGLPVAAMRTQEEQIRKTLGTEQLFAGLVSMFGLLATGLAAIGLYGVLSYAVSRRTAEIGIRMALGATRGNVLWHMMRGGMAAVAIGLAAGLPAALALTRITRSLLYGVTPGDAATFVAAALVLLAVSAAAAWIPAHRGARIQPTQALRYD